ncbi:glycosyl hydrolase [Fulvivirgaceae bacterium BMA10]|uniref:Glycosyl hydrolase n=1 Tax=Splendidivirga corallicola TaxID=3051826 RepID=A0ABT8KNZ6_9BACT|nr:glycosyl hydrolase [Fulvivirgaceae bacterium BMA10]
MKRLLILLVFFSSCNQVGTKKAIFSESEKIAKSDVTQKLRKGFINPPLSSRPGAYWCWLNGDVTKSSITNDLEEMKAKGMGRAEIWDVAAVHNPDGAYGVGPKFLGEESVDMIKHAMSEAKRLELKLGLIASSGWNAGGDWVTPDWASKVLFHSELKIKGGRKINQLEIPFPEVGENCPKNQSGRPVWYKEVALIAVPDHPDKKIKSIDEVMVLNKQFDGKVLNWNAPEGNWTIIRYICSNTGQRLIVPSPKSSGLFIDFLDPQATRRHLAHILSRLGITKENAKESGLDYLEFDSMELDHGTPWTDKMDSIFYAQNGYSIEQYMPIFSGWEMEEGNEQFKYHFDKTVSNQIIFSHYTTAREFLKEYDMEIVAEAGGPGPPIWNTCPVDALKALGNVSVPRGEFWIRHRNMFLIKQIASASHIYGLEHVDAESFTTWRRWKDAPHDLKPYVDRAFCEGLNMITFHTFANTRPEHGLPGRTYHAGSDINPTVTWWEQSKPFMDYLSRCSYMLKQGKFAADVVYYYGDKAPNFFPEFHDVPVKPGLEGLDAGYDFDLVNTDVLLNRMKTSKGKLVLPDGMEYKLLVLPNREDIPDEVVKKVEQMIAAGANVLIQNPQIAKNVKGSAYKNMSIDEALDRLSISKDFTANTEKLDFIHRKIGGTDMYFIRNKTGQPISDTCVFRVKNIQPEFWDPVTAQQYEITDAKSVDNKTEINLQLPPYGSCFILFNAQSGDLPNYERQKNSLSLEVKGPWTLSFPKGWGAPSSIQLDKLISWTDHDNQGVKYFSGTASYKNSFNISRETLDSGDHFILNLEEVLDVAEVFVNEKSVGILWTKPFKIDIKDYVKEGNNNLEIKITNMWINRLTGDINLPEDQRFCKTNHPPFTAPDDIEDKTYRLQKSGLMGPVTLEIIETDKK